MSRKCSDNIMVWLVYLNELKERLVYNILSSFFSIVVIFYYGEEYLIYLSKGFYEVTGMRRFIYTDLLEVLWVYLKISFYGGTIVFVLGLLINILLFSFAILDSEELYSILKGIFWLGIVGYFYLYYIYQLYIKLLISSLLNVSSIKAVEVLDITLEPKVGEYIFLVLKGSSLFLLVFCLICILIFSGQLGLISWDVIIGFRGVIYLIYIVLILLMLPPDIILHSLVFITGFVAFEVCLLLMYIVKEYKVRLVEW